MPGPLAFAALLTAYDDVFRLADGPEPVVRGALAALAPLGRKTPAARLRELNNALGSYT